MSKLKFLGIGFVFLIGCRDEISKFLFDSAKMSNLIQYEYKFEQNKKIEKIEKYYTIMFGQVVDTMISKTNYVYNKKGLLEKEIRSQIHDGKPDIKLYNYDLNDSLIAEVDINSDGDTTFIEKYANYPDGKKRIYLRYLVTRVDPNADFETWVKNKRTYDTTLVSNDYIYEKNECKSLKEYDKYQRLSKIIEYYYKGKRVDKEIHYSFFNNIKLLTQIKYFDYSKNDLIPDYYSLSSKNDTIGYCINDFKNKKLTTSTESFESGNVINKLFYENGKVIGDITISKDMNRKNFYLTSYYDNGEIKEGKSYNEKINAR
jgi:hypothetical protein